MNNSEVFKNYKKWSDKYFDIQKQIIKENLNNLDYNKVKYKNAEMNFKYDKKKDSEENTDLILIPLFELDFALRVRNLNEGIFLNFPNLRDLTIRSKSNNNQETEFDKILNGYGDYMLYCWADEKKLFIQYILFDLDYFRREHNNFFIKQQPNKKDNTEFNIYTLKNFKYISWGKKNIKNN